MIGKICDRFSVASAVGAVVEDGAGAGAWAGAEAGAGAGTGTGAVGAVHYAAMRRLSGATFNYRSITFDGSLH